MSEKVLGFKLEDSALAVELKDTSFERDVRVIDIRNLIPVRLASESVSVEELEKELREREKKIWQGTQTLIGHESDIEKVDAMKEVANWEINHIRSWIKNQVSKK